MPEQTQPVTSWWQRTNEHALDIYIVNGSVGRLAVRHPRYGDACEWQSEICMQLRWISRGWDAIECGT